MTGYDPDDLRTHQTAWRKALEIARDGSDADDRSYWEHEIEVFDRTLMAITGGPNGNRIRELKAGTEPAREPKEHPDGYGKWWHDHNPWAQNAIYVPVGELARALGHPDVPEHWLAYSGRLDAYILPQPNGFLHAGVRYGTAGEQYLSPNTYSKLAQEELLRLADEYGNDRGYAAGP